MRLSLLLLTALLVACQSGKPTAGSGQIEKDRNSSDSLAGSDSSSFSFNGNDYRLLGYCIERLGDKASEK